MGVKRVCNFFATVLYIGIIVTGMTFSDIGDIETGVRLIGIGASGGILWYGLSKVLGD